MADLLEEKVFIAHFPGGRLASNAFWHLLKIRNIEPVSISGKSYQLYISTFGKTAERNMKSIIKKYRGRIEK